MTLRYSRPLLVLIGVIASSLFIVPGPLGLAPVDYVLGVVILLGLVGGTTHERQPPWSRSSFKLASGLWLATMVLASAFSDDRSAAFLQTGKNAAGLLYLCVSISAAVALPESVLLRWTAPVVGALCLAIVLDIYITMWVVAKVDSFQTRFTRLRGQASRWWSWPQRSGVVVHHVSRPCSHARWYFFWRARSLCTLDWWRCWSISTSIAKGSCHSSICCPWEFLDSHNYPTGGKSFKGS